MVFICEDKLVEDQSHGLVVEGSSVMLTSGLAYKNMFSLHTVIDHLLDSHSQHIQTS